MNTLQLLNKITVFLCAISPLFFSFSVSGIGGWGLMTGLIPLFYVALLLKKNISKEALKRSILYIIFLIFCIFHLFGYEITQKNIYNLTVWVGFLLLFISQFGGTKIEIDFEIKRFSRIFFISTFFYVAIAYYYYLSNYSLSAFATLGILYFSGIYFYNKYINRSLLNYFLLALIYILLFVSQARMPFILINMLLIILVVYERRRYWFLKVSSLTVLILISFIGYFTYSESFRDSFIRGDNAIRYGDVNINTSGRMAIWKLSIDSWSENKLLGTGQDAPDEVLSHGRQNHPHNDYLRVLHHYGIIGFLIWFSWIVVYLKQNLARLNNQYDSYAIRFLDLLNFTVVLAFIVSMITDNTLVYSFYLYPMAIISGMKINLLGKT